MIKTEKLTINGRAFIRSYSDTHYIMRDGVEYEEAIDPIDSGRGYTESETPLPELSAEEALDIIVNGGKTDA